MKPHDVQRVGVDLFALKMHTFLTAIDKYSGYFDVQELNSTTSTRDIANLKPWFSRHGIPVTVVSDNGPSFNSEDFKTFSKEWDFTTSHQVLFTRKVMVALKTPPRPSRHC